MTGRPADRPAAPGTQAGETRGGEAWGAPLVLALAGMLLALDALPGLHWHDTAEFAGVGRVLGVAHSPGHPLTVLWIHAAQTLVPVGDAAFRANLASAVALSLALAVFYRLLRQSAPAVPWLASAAVALLPALAPAVWLQGVRAEVYAPQAVLTVAILWLSLRLAARSRPPTPTGPNPGASTCHEPRALVLLGLVFGLGGANHALLALYLLPVALVAVAWGRPPLRAILAGAAAGLVGLLTCALLPLRALAGDVVGWGRPDSLTGFVDMLLAREWHWILNPDARLGHLDYLVAALVYVLDALGPSLALGAGLALGLGLLPTLRRARPALALGLLWLLLTLLTQHPFNFDPANPDVGGYFLGAALAVIFLGHLGLGALGLELPAAARRPAAAAVIALPILALALTFAHRDPGARRGARSADRFARALLDAVPPQGALVASDYASHFLALGLRATEGWRPDVAPIFRGQRALPWFRDRLAVVHPQWAARLAQLPGDPAWASPAARFEPGVKAERLGDLAARLGPAGLLLRVTDGPPTAAAVDGALAAWDAQRPSDLDARRALGFHRLQHALHGRTQPPGPAWRRLVEGHLRGAADLVGAPAVTAALAALGPEPQPARPQPAETHGAGPLPPAPPPAKTPPDAGGVDGRRPPGEATAPPAQGSEASVE